MQWAIGLPLIVALLLSVLNAIMGCARSLYQASEDEMLPRWFGHLNVHGVPDRAMAFNVICSILVLLFGSPLRIYIFSNIGYLFAVMMGFFSYAVHRQTRPEVERPVGCPVSCAGSRWSRGRSARGCGSSADGTAPSVVVGTPSHGLFLLGVLILAAYVPLHLWRRFTDRALRRRVTRRPPTELAEGRRTAPRNCPHDRADQALAPAAAATRRPPHRATWWRCCDPTPPRRRELLAAAARGRHGHCGAAAEDPRLRVRHAEPGPAAHRREREAADDAITATVRGLEHAGIDVDGQIVVTRNAAKAIARIARRRGATRVLLERITASRLRRLLEGDLQRQLARKLGRSVTVDTAA